MRGIRHGEQAVLFVGRQGAPARNAAWRVLGSNVWTDADRRPGFGADVRDLVFLAGERKLREFSRVEVISRRFLGEDG